METDGLTYDDMMAALQESLEMVISDVVDTPETDEPERESFDPAFSQEEVASWLVAIGMAKHSNRFRRFSGVDLLQLTFANLEQATANTEDAEAIWRALTEPTTSATAHVPTNHPLVGYAAPLSPRLSTVKRWTTRARELRKVLRRVRLRTHFISFAETQYSSENIHFWVAVECYRDYAVSLTRQTPSKAEQLAQQKAAETIVTQYIVEGARQQVHLPLTEVSALLNESEYSSSSFDQAQSLVFSLMASSLWDDFCRSSQFEEMIRAPETIPSGDYLSLERMYTLLHDPDSGLFAGRRRRRVKKAPTRASSSDLVDWIMSFTRALSREYSCKIAQKLLEGGFVGFATPPLKLSNQNISRFVDSSSKQFDVCPHLPIIDTLMIDAAHDTGETDTPTPSVSTNSLLRLVVHLFEPVMEHEDYVLELLTRIEEEEKEEEEEGQHSGHGARSLVEEFRNSPLSFCNYMLKRSSSYLAVRSEFPFQMKVGDIPKNNPCSVMKDYHFLNRMVTAIFRVSQRLEKRFGADFFAVQAVRDKPRVHANMLRQDESSNMEHLVPSDPIQTELAGLDELLQSLVSTYPVASASPGVVRKSATQRHDVAYGNVPTTLRDVLSTEERASTVLSWNPAIIATMLGGEAEQSTDSVLETLPVNLKLGTPDLSALGQPPLPPELLTDATDPTLDPAQLSEGVSGSSSDELCKDDDIRLLPRDIDTWSQISVNEEVAAFPLEIVEEGNSSLRWIDKPKEIGKKEGHALEPSRYVRAVYRFKGVDVDEVAMKAGDLMLVLRQIEGWYIGQNTRTGEEGMFPGEPYTEPCFAGPDEVAASAMAAGYSCAEHAWFQRDCSACAMLSYDVKLSFSGEQASDNKSANLEQRLSLALNSIDDAERELLTGSIIGSSLSPRPQHPPTEKVDGEETLTQPSHSECQGDTQLLSSSESVPTRVTRAKSWSKRVGSSKKAAFSARARQTLRHRTDSNLIKLASYGDGDARNRLTTMLSMAENAFTSQLLCLKELEANIGAEAGADPLETFGVSTVTLQRIFGGIPDLHRLHSAFSKRLEELVMMWDGADRATQGIGALLLSHALQITHLTSFLEALPRAFSLLRIRMQRSAKLRDVISRFWEDHAVQEVVDQLKIGKEGRQQTGTNAAESVGLPGSDAVPPILPKPGNTAKFLLRLRASQLLEAEAITPPHFATRDFSKATELQSALTSPDGHINAASASIVAVEEADERISNGADVCRKGTSSPSASRDVPADASSCTTLGDISSTLNWRLGTRGSDDDQLACIEEGLQLLLSLPLQRLEEYVKFLAGAKEVTAPAHPDYPALLQAHQRFVALAALGQRTSLAHIQGRFQRCSKPLGENPARSLLLEATTCCQMAENLRSEKYTGAHYRAEPETLFSGLPRSHSNPLRSLSLRPLQREALKMKSKGSGPARANQGESQVPTSSPVSSVEMSPLHHPKQGKERRVKKAGPGNKEVVANVIPADTLGTLTAGSTTMLCFEVKADSLWTGELVVGDPTIYTVKDETGSVLDEFLAEDSDDADFTALRDGPGPLSETQSLSVFLFTDILILAAAECPHGEGTKDEHSTEERHISPRRNCLIEICRLPLAQTVAKSCPGAHKAFDIVPGCDGLVVSGGDTRPLVRIHISSKRDRDNWLSAYKRAVRDAIAEHHEDRRWARPRPESDASRLAASVGSQLHTTDSRSIDPLKVRRKQMLRGVGGSRRGSGSGKSRSRLSRS